MALPFAFILAIVMCVAQARPQEAYIPEDHADIKDFNEWMLEFMIDMLRTIDSHLKLLLDEFAEITQTGLNDGDTSSVFVIQRMIDQDHEDSLKVDETNLHDQPKYVPKLECSQETIVREENPENVETPQDEISPKYEEALEDEISSKHDESPKYEEMPEDEECPHYFTTDYTSPPDCDLVSPAELE